VTSFYVCSRLHSILILARDHKTYTEMTRVSDIHPGSKET
jgi:hypothetical protein